MTRQTVLVRLDDIEVGDRYRRASEADVDRLAGSIRDIGLRTPISIRYRTEEDGANIFEIPVLVTGLTRLRAVQKLGWEKVEAFVTDGDETDARMWEIAENLHRAELTALERDEQIAEWVKLAADKEKSLSQPVTNQKGGRPATVGTRAAERDLGINRMDASRATKVASLSPEAKEVARELGLDDNRSVLLAAAKAPDATEFLRNQPAVKQADKAISLTNAEQFAEWLLARTDLDELPTLISWLEGTKPGDVIRALRRQSA